MSEQAKLGQRQREEARAAQEVSDLMARRTDAVDRLREGRETDLALGEAVRRWLNASEDDLRRLNIQHAALRARTETARGTASRAVARQNVLEELIRRRFFGRR